MSPPGGSQPPSPSHHPDLNDEVATLSNKLINAINHQTNLGDMLNQTRSELDASRERIRQLEAEAEGHATQITNGSLVDFGVVKAERTKLLASLTEEAKKRGAAEKEKAAIELELENLTTALFEEANKVRVSHRLMVCLLTPGRWSVLLERILSEITKPWKRKTRCSNPN